MTVVDALQVVATDGRHGGAAPDLPATRRRARKVLLPIGGLPEIASPDELGKIDARKRVYHDIELMTVHIMSSCRMGADAARGPTDAYGRLHDAPNVVAADASVIPSSIGVNPMETIVALALRNADRWAENARRLTIDRLRAELR